MAGFDPSLHTFHSPKLQSVVSDAISFFGQTPVYPLPPEVLFSGCGVYALYYSGDFPLYSKIAEANRLSSDKPIYVGKAVAPGWRTARVKESSTPDLYRRLHEHAGSIAQTKDLKVGDFTCRFMILEGIEGDLIVPVEAQLIRYHRPLWNSIVDGFGNHDPGAGRYNQARSEWDVLHPGRKWAERLTGQSPDLDSILSKIRQEMED